MRRMLNKTRPGRACRRDVEPLERRVLLSAAALAADAEIYNGHTYVVIGRDGVDWIDAEAQARQMGGHLVTINDAAENDFVAGLIRQRIFEGAAAWMGFTDDRAYGGHEAGYTSGSPYPPAGNRWEGWVWASGEPVTFQNWHPGEPNNDGPQSYGVLMSGSFWDDYTPEQSLLPGVVEIPSDQPLPYEAEQARITGAGVSATHSGFTGSGYVDFSHAAGDSVEFTVDAPAAGRFELGFRYANGGTSTRSLGLWVNGAAVPGGATFAPTGSWRTWNALPITVPLVAGANKVRLLATGQSGPNLDSLSVAPVTPPESVTYQAESATLSGPVVGSDVAGYTGTGFADYQRSSRDYVEFPVEVPADGSYALDFRYANGGRNDRPLELRVDGQVLTGRMSFGPTGRWSTWKTRSQPVVLTAGRHEVRLTSIGFNGPNLDALTVTKAPPPPTVRPATLQAEAADLSGPVVASDAGGFTGTGFADYQHGTGDFVEFTYDAPVVGDYTLAFRYANGSTSDRPLELRVNGAVARRNLSFGPTGAWSAWRTVTATVALPAGINKLRLTSIGQNGPNLDAVKVTAVGGPQDGLIAFYPLSGNANDVVGGHHGAVNGATLTGGGYEGQAYTFDGNNDYIHLAGLDINPDVRPNLTMGAWVRPTDDSPVRQVISHDDSDFDRSLGIDYRGGGIGWSAFSGTAGVVGYAPVELDAWTFVAVTYDQAASDVRLYVNGDTYRVGGSLGPGHPFTDIGRNPSYGEYFAGTIDNVFFFDRVLTEAEIAAIRAGGEAAIRGYAL